MMLSEPDAWLFLWAALIFYWLGALLSPLLPVEARAAQQGTSAFVTNRLWLTAGRDWSEGFTPPSVSLITQFSKTFLLVKQGKAQVVRKESELACNHWRDLLGAL